MKIFKLLVFITIYLYSDVGYISAIRGDVYIEREDSIVNGAKGFQLKEKDVITTGERGKAQIIFKDRTVVKLGRSSTIKIDEFLFNNTKNSKFKAQVKRGFFDVVTGEIGKIARDNFALKTKTATIGVRGTHFQGSSLKDREEFKCLKGEIVVQSKESIYGLKAGESIKLYIDKKFQNPNNRRENRDINLDNRYRLELSKNIKSMIDEIQQNDINSYGSAIGNAYIEIQKIDDSILQEYAMALLLRETYEATIDNLSNNNKVDVTDQFFENSLAKFGFSQDDKSIFFWQDGRNFYTDYLKVADSMGGLNKDGKLVEFWNGQSDDRTIINYEGYYIGKNFEIISENFDIDNVETIVDKSTNNLISLSVDFGNRYTNLSLTRSGENYQIANLQALSQYGLIDAYRDNLVVTSDSVVNNPELFSAFSYFYGENIDEVGGEVSYSNSNDFMNVYTYIVQQQETIDLYKKSIDSDNIFSWGYWAFKDGEDERLRGSWIISNEDVTPQNVVDEYIQSSAKATYSGSVFGTLENIDGSKAENLKGGDFKLNFDFAEQNIDGEFNIYTQTSEFNVEAVGTLENSSFDLKGENFLGDGKLFGKSGEYIGGGFNFVTDEQDIVMGAFKGNKE